MTKNGSTEEQTIFKIEMKSRTMCDSDTSNWNKYNITRTEICLGQILWGRQVGKTGSVKDIRLMEHLFQHQHLIWMQIFNVR